MSVSSSRRKELRFLLFSFSSYLILFLILFHGVAFQGASFVKRDIIRFYYPVWNFSVGAIKSGVFPLWNPYNSFGTPFFADIQTCVLYPLTLLLYLPNYCWAFNFYILVHLALSGFFTLLWMRECRASREAAFLSGLAYALGGYVMSAISLTISLATLVYFPLVLLTLRRVFHSNRFFWKAIAALILLVQYFGGDPAIFFATLVVTSLFVIYKSITASFIQKKLYLKYALDYATVVLLFLGLSLFHSLLFFEFLMNSNRAKFLYDDVTMWSVQYNDLISLFFPYFSDLSILFMDYWLRQSWLENAYTGVTVLLLAGAAIQGIRKNALVGYHVLLAFFGIALALGRFCSVYDILYHGFPFFKFIRYPVRFLFLFSFAAACLSGFGLDEVLSRFHSQPLPKESKRKGFVGAFIVLFFTGIIILSTIFAAEIESAIIPPTQRFLSHWTHQNYGIEVMPDIVIPVLSNIRRTAIFLCLFFLGMLAVRHFRPRNILVALFFSLLVFADLSEVNVIEIQLDGKVLQQPSKNLARVIEDKSIYRFVASPKSVKLQYQPPGLATFDLTLSSLRETLTPNLLLPYRVSDVHGYDSIFLRDSLRINEERRDVKDPTEQRFFDMMNIKYMVSPKASLGDSYQLVRRSDPVNLFQNERVLPRAFLVSAASVEKDREEILKKIADKKYDPERILYLDQDPRLEDAPSSNALPEGRVNITEYSPNRVRMEVDSKRFQWLFLSDMFYPGWKALVDGKPVEIYRANYTFRAILMPQGEHRVEWNYDPILFKIGCGVSLLTFLGLITALFFGRKPRIL